MTDPKPTLARVEVALVLALGTLLLRQTYRADLVLGRDSRRGVRVASTMGQGGARGGAPRRLLGGVARQELLWLWRSPAQGLRLLLCVPAIAVNLANAFVVGRFSAVTSSPMVSQPDLMLALRASPFALVSVACIVAPIVEEVLYRGLLFSALRPRHGLAIALLGSATLFALHHPVAQIVPTLAVGAFTTLAFVRSRSLYAAILVHVLCNGFSVGLQLCFPPS